MKNSDLLVRSLDELLEKEPEEAKFLFSSEPSETFSWLNALARDALLLTPENKTIKKPIHVLNIMTGNRNKLVSPRIIVN